MGKGPFINSDMVFWEGGGYQTPILPHDNPCYFWLPPTINYVIFGWMVATGQPQPKHLHVYCVVLKHKNCSRAFIE